MELRAETALNIFNALPQSEQARFVSMIGFLKAPKVQKRKPLITDAIATEYILNLYKHRTNK